MNNRYKHHFTRFGMFFRWFFLGNTDGSHNKWWLLVRLLVTTAIITTLWIGPANVYRWGSSLTGKGTTGSTEKKKEGKKSRSNNPASVPTTVALSDTALEKKRIKFLTDSLTSIRRLTELRKEALVIESKIRCELEHLETLDGATPPCTHKEPSQKVFVQKKSSPNQRTSGHISKSGPIGPHEVIYQ